MAYLLEILKIIDGAIRSDRAKVIAYVEQLAEKLETDGDSRAATRLRKAIESKNSDIVSLASFASNNRMPVDSESRLSLADEELIAQSETEIFLEPDVSEIVEEFLRYVGAVDRLLAEGVGISPSLIIYGPPGCGKTELARYISAYLKLPLLTARTDSLISSYLGSTAKNLRMLFEHSMSRPCVLLLDEFDAVGKLRDDRHELGELKRVVVSLLQNIDAMDNETVLIAATNHEHLLDPAIWRRFAYKVYMGFPSFEIRKKLFNKFLANFSNQKQINLFASVSEGLSGSDIRLLSESAVRATIIEDKNQIEETKVLKHLLKLRFPEDTEDGIALEAQLKRARDLNSKIFTVRRLAKIFRISIGRVSTLLKETE